MIRKTAKRAIAVASAALATMAVTPGVAQAAIMPDSRCINGFVCFSHNSINPSAVWLVPKPTGGGYCIKLSQPGNNFWNRRGHNIVVYNDSVAGCLSGAVIIEPGGVYNSSMNYTAVRQW